MRHNFTKLCFSFPFPQIHLTTLMNNTDMLTFFQLIYVSVKLTQHIRNNLSLVSEAKQATCTRKEKLNSCQIRHLSMGHFVYQQKRLIFQLTYIRQFYQYKTNNNHISTFGSNIYVSYTASLLYNKQLRLDHVKWTQSQCHV